MIVSEVYRERDEARNEAKEIKKLLAKSMISTIERGKQIAALRDALELVLPCLVSNNDLRPYPIEIDHQELAEAVLSNTTEAAALYLSVDHFYKLTLSKPLQGVQGTYYDFFIDGGHKGTVMIDSVSCGDLNDCKEFLIAATPISKVEEGEG